jgi:hypothetical protein
LYFVRLGVNVLIFGVHLASRWIGGFETLLLGCKRSRVGQVRSVVRLRLCYEMSPVGFGAQRGEGTLL